MEGNMHVKLVAYEKLYWLINFSRHQTILILGIYSENRISQSCLHEWVARNAELVKQNSTSKRF
jgi:hypothetical protein